VLTLGGGKGQARLPLPAPRSASHRSCAQSSRHGHLLLKKSIDIQKIFLYGFINGFFFINMDL
jgi:hypothetical protein